MAYIESKLSEVMGKQRVSISDLARDAKIAYGTAHALYHHTNERIDYRVLASVCDALGVRVCDVLEVVPDK